MSDFILIETPAKFYDWLKEQNITRKITRIQNHHTWKPDYGGFLGDNHESLHNGMRNYHINNNGWSDIAQTFTTYPDGCISIGRSINKTPVGIKGANTGSICKEHIGNFDLDEPNDKHKRFIVMYNAILLNNRSLDANDQTLLYHHWFHLGTGKRNNGGPVTTNKTCPGVNFFGGNTVEAANNNFIPLIEKEMRCDEWK